MTDELDALIHEAAEWLRIPSISAGARNEAALREAAVWAQRRVLAAGGTCDLVDTPGGSGWNDGAIGAAIIGCLLLAGGLAIAVTGRRPRTPDTPVTA